MAAVDYFLKLDGIEGESTDAKHKGELVLESFGWGVSHAGAGGGAGGGGGAGKAQFQDLVVVLRTSKASPKLFLGLRDGPTPEVGGPDRAEGWQGAARVPDDHPGRRAGLVVPGDRLGRRGAARDGLAEVRQDRDRAPVAIGGGQGCAAGEGRLRPQARQSALRTTRGRLAPPSRGSFLACDASRGAGRGRGRHGRGRRGAGDPPPGAAAAPTWPARSAPRGRPSSRPRACSRA